MLIIEHAHILYVLYLFFEKERCIHIYWPIDFIHMY